MDRRTKTGRISFFAYLFYPHFASHFSVAILTAFLQFPAFFSSCTREERPDSVSTKAQIYIQWSEIPTPEALDLFFFHTDGAMRLDAYQQVTGLDRNLLTYGLSGAGPRRLVVLSGNPGDIYSWADIQTYGSLAKLRFSLEEEDPEQPRLVGETLLEEAQSRKSRLTLQPMLCIIRIRSVAADFSGHPYAGTPFINNRLFLINAGTEYRPLDKEGGGPVSWMNLGSLDSVAVAGLPHPDMLMQEGCGSVGTRRLYPDRLFFCYANPAAEDQPGRPVTRMVLEGDIGPVHCYYPINLPAMEAGTCYQLDLTLTRMGSPDPDIPVESGTVIIESGIQPWKRRDAETLLF
jgi:hypothetical protein